MVPWEIWRLPKEQKNCDPICVLSCTFNTIFEMNVFCNSWHFTGVGWLTAYSDHHCDKAFASVLLLVTAFPLNENQDLMDRVNRNRNAFPTVEHHHKYIRHCVWIHVVESIVQDFSYFLFCLCRLLLFPLDLARLCWGLCREPSHTHCSLDGVFCLLFVCMHKWGWLFCLAFLILPSPHLHFLENWWCRWRTWDETSCC